MPAGGERQVEAISKGSAQNAHIAGAGDVHEIGLEASEHLVNQRHVAQIRRIETQVFLQWEGEYSARQLKGPNVALFDKGLAALAGADAEKGQIAPPGEGLKMAAG